MLFIVLSIYYIWYHYIVIVYGDYLTVYYVVCLPLCFDRYSIRKDLDAAAESVSGNNMLSPPVSLCI